MRAVTAALILSIPSISVADNQQEGWKILIEATAAQHLCPIVELDPAGVEALRKHYALIESEEIYPELQDKMKNTLNSFAKLTVEQICIAGMLAYGTEGLQYPGVLRRKTD